MTHAGHNPALSDLRRRIVALERSARASRPALAFGLPALDDHLPWGGLPLGTVHECLESGADSEHAAAATLFLAGILARTRGTVLWCLRGQDLFAPALASVGLGPDRVIYVEARKDAEVLPAMEEGLRHGGLAGVVGEVARLGLTASRRLQLAAEGTGVPAFALRRWRNESERASGAEPSAVFTRWRISPVPSKPPQASSKPPQASFKPPQALAQPPPAGLGRALWRVELLRCRGAEATEWVLEACDAQGRLALPSVLPDRSNPEARPARTGEEPRDGGSGKLQTFPARLGDLGRPRRRALG